MCFGGDDRWIPRVQGLVNVESVSMSWWCHHRCYRGLYCHYSSTMLWFLVNSCDLLIQGVYSLSGRTYCRQISWSLEATRVDVIIIVPLWNLTGISAALLPMCLSNFKTIGKVETRISRLRDFTRSGSKTSVRLGPYSSWLHHEHCSNGIGNINLYQTTGSYALM